MRLFALLPAAGVAWLRVATGAVVLVVWRRPWRRSWTGLWPLIAAFGLSLAAMNLCFYLAIDRIPLGTAVAIEFLGPITVAALGTRRLRNLAALAIAAIGVGALSEVQIGGGPLGVALALAAACFWALYIVLAHRIARRGASLGGLALAMAVGALAIAPLAAPAALPALADPAVLAACVGVGLLSSVLPYALDQVVLRRLGTAAFALLLSLLPATATVIGLVALHQVPTPLEALGIGLVVVAVAVRSGD